MPIPDEAREALTGAFSFESSRGNVDHRPGYYVNRVDSVLTANGYTVVKVTDLHQQATATPDDISVVARRLGYVPIPDEAAVADAITRAFGPHDETAEFCDGCTAGDWVRSEQAVAAAVLALLRGEGQTDG